MFRLMNGVIMGLIQQLINSDSKILLLEKLADKKSVFSVSELGRLAGIPKATVSVIVIDWEKAGLVESQHQGRNKLIKINQKFFLLAELKKIFRKTSDFVASNIKQD